MEFHARHKMALLARDPIEARRLGQLAAASRPETWAADRDSYARAFAHAMARGTSVGGHVNALQHLLGHVENRDLAQELAVRIERYRQGAATLADVKVALRDSLVAGGASWAADQSYLEED